MCIRDRRGEPYVVPSETHGVAAVSWQGKPIHGLAYQEIHLAQAFLKCAGRSEERRRETQSWQETIDGANKYKAVGPWKRWFLWNPVAYSLQLADDG